MKHNQYELLKEIQAIGINVVTCGNCGDVVLHRISDEVITCPHCGIESDPCDFPDLCYDEEPRKSKEPLSLLTLYPSIIPSELSRNHLISMCTELQIAKNHNKEFIEINLNGVRYHNPVSRLKEYQELCTPMTGRTRAVS